MAKAKPREAERTERLGLRITPELKAALEKCAATERRTMSNWAVLALERAVADATKK